MSIEIYRVENSEGQGMYCGSSQAIQARGLNTQPNAVHPHPSQDSSIKEWYYSHHQREEHFFGFASLSQLRMWVHNQELRNKLSEQGFVINVYIPSFTSPYIVTDFVIGDTQAIFNKSLFTIINTININSLT